jgi:glycosyltransferase involved in cell wall biosynthesis
MSTTKVLHVIARMNVGGTARYVSELVANIPDSKLATGFVQGSEVEDPSVSQLPVLRINHLGRRISLLNDYKAWLELRAVVREHKPEIIHTHTFKAGLIGRLVPGKHKHIHTFHGHLFGDNSFSRFEKRVITLVEKWLASRADVLVSVGLNVGNELREAGIGVTQQWVSIAPGVMALTLSDKLEARRSIGANESGILIGWMARMNSVKNPKLLLDVAIRLPDVNFVMAGGGELLETTKSNAPGNVKVIGWADAAIFWSAVDVAISTSDNEGMPIALIEAQLAGIPVIATNVGSNSEVIEDQVTGFITSKSIDSLAAAVDRFKSVPNLIQTQGNRGRKRANMLFPLEKMIQHHVDIYREVSILRPTC